MHLLLDFDGVVLKKHPAFKVVSYRCERFVQKYYPRLNRNEIQEVNRKLYTDYGHTLIGLQKTLGTVVNNDHRESRNIDIADFNKQVYCDLNYLTLFDNIQNTNKNDVENYKKTIKYCKENNINVKIFSNAPSSWCINIQYMMGVSSPIEDLYDKVTSCHIKPSAESYKLVDDCLQDQKYVFIDDKEINLLPIRNDKKWIPICMGNRKIESSGIDTYIENLFDVVKSDCFFGEKQCSM